MTQMGPFAIKFETNKQNAGLRAGCLAFLLFCNIYNVCHYLLSDDTNRRLSLYLVYKMPRCGCRSVLHSDCTMMMVQVMYKCDEVKLYRRKQIVAFVFVNHDSAQPSAWYSEYIVFSSRSVAFVTREK